VNSGAQRRDFFNDLLHGVHVADRPSAPRATPQGHLVNLIDLRRLGTAVALVAGFTTGSLASVVGDLLTLASAKRGGLPRRRPLSFFQLLPKLPILGPKFIHRGAKPLDLASQLRDGSGRLIVHDPHPSSPRYLSLTLSDAGPILMQAKQVLKPVANRSQRAPQAKWRCRL